MTDLAVALRDALEVATEALREVEKLGLCNGGSTRELEARCFLDAFKIATTALAHLDSICNPEDQ